MARDPRYDILFQPMKIGPVTTKNRFYQVPHCNGIGDRWPHMLAAMREVKAEGGWGVVCTEACSVHPSADFAPSVASSSLIFFAEYGIGKPQHPPAMKCCKNCPRATAGPDFTLVRVI